MKGISQDERRGFNKYKLNYTKNTRETSANTYVQPNIHHWKLRKM
jgi:hypothetical protein